MKKLIPAMLAIILSPAFAADVVQVPWETSVTTDKFTGVTATTAKTIIVMADDAVGLDVACIHGKLAVFITSSNLKLRGGIDHQAPYLLDGKRQRFLTFDLVKGALVYAPATSGGALTLARKLATHSEFAVRVSTYFNGAVPLHFDLTKAREHIDRVLTSCGDIGVSELNGVDESRSLDEAR